MMGRATRGKTYSSRRWTKPGSLHQEMARRGALRMQLIQHPTASRKPGSQGKLKFLQLEPKRFTQTCRGSSRVATISRLMGWTAPRQSAMMATTAVRKVTEAHCKPLERCDHGCSKRCNPLVSVNMTLCCICLSNLPGLQQANP